MYVVVADSYWARLRGLLGRSGLEPGEGLLLWPANSVHTAFMRFPIDVVFLDRDLTVLDVVEGLPPWRVTARRGARAVLELGAGEAARQGIAPGDCLAERPGRR
jgi:uncharacterized membrane protein (UPF0127 family)